MQLNTGPEDTVSERGIFMTLTTYSVKHLGVMSVAKIGAVLGLIFGLVEGIIIGIMAVIIGSAATAGFGPLLGMGVGGLIVFFAIIIGLIGGFVGGAIYAFIYNVAARYVGPIEVDLEIKA
jgi:hypothetical protein